MDLLDIEVPKDHWKASRVDVSPLLHLPAWAKDFTKRFTVTKRDLPGKVMDIELIKESKPAFEEGKKVVLSRDIRNNT